jgi:hypothetical protein
MPTKEANFSNREIKAMFGRIEEMLRSHDDVHNAILSQTTTTNGKVADIQKWRERMSGGIIVCAFVIPTFFGVIGWMAYQITNFDKQVQEALSVYESPNEKTQSNP